MQRDEILSEVHREVEHVLQETESATLNVGELLEEIVRDAGDFVSTIQAEVGALSSEDGADITSTLNRQHESVGSFIDEVSSAVNAQSRVADEIISTSKNVASAAQSVATISMQSRILCFNTMVEAGRLGDLGRPFMVIAGEMRELSESIAESNEQVSQLAEALLPLLKDVKERIAGLEAEMGRFADSFGEQRQQISGVTEALHSTTHRTLELGDERIAKIVERSNEALVCLQTQDLISQRLRRAMRLSGQEVDGGTLMSDEIPPATDGGEDALGSGEVMLF